MVFIKIVRVLSGLLLVLQCLVLIAFFGIMPLIGFDVCPVDGSSSGSLYKDGSLAFVQEVSASDLAAGDIALYYKGRTATGSEIASNDKANAAVVVKTDDGTASVPYRKISGKGSSFSVPMLGKYAGWLVHGDGLRFSVIILGAFFGVFALSAFLVREN